MKMCSCVFVCVLGEGYGKGHDHPHQCSCLENSMDSEAWWATVHGVAKNQTQLSDFHFSWRIRLQVGDQSSQFAYV